MKTAAAHAGLPTGRITPRLAAMVIAAEGTRAGPALTARLCVATRGTVISLKRPGPYSGPVECAAARTWTSAPVEIVPVVKRPAAGVVPVMVINGEVVVPIESPMMPAPPVAAEEADPKASSEGEKWSFIPDPRIRIPSRPRPYRASINYPGIIGRHVNHIGLRRFNDYRRALRRYRLLRRALQIAGLLGSLAHYLHRIHHILFLVVIRVA